MKRPHAAFLLSAAGAAGAVALSRYTTLQRLDAAQTVAEKLLERNLLLAVEAIPEDESPRALSECARWFFWMLNETSSLECRFAGGDTRLTRTASVPFYRATARTAAELVDDGTRLTYEASLPGLVEIRGCRVLGPRHIDRMIPARAAPEDVTLTFATGYEVHAEARLELAEPVLFGQGRFSGHIALRDNRGSSARIHIALDGSLSGAVTRDNAVAGRFGGTARDHVEFRPYSATVSAGASAEQTSPETTVPTE